MGSFHVDHIVARQAWRRRQLENLALACLHSNQRKSPNIAGRNPETDEIVQLFHPRRDQWFDHFEWSGADLIGKTRIGRLPRRAHPMPLTADINSCYLSAYHGSPAMGVVLPVPPPLFWLFGILTHLSEHNETTVQLRSL